MENTFEKDFTQFVCNRTKATDAQLFKDPQYLKYRDEDNIAFQNLKAVVPSDMFGLILDYEAAIAAVMSYETKYAYKQGMRDGISLQYELGLTPLQWMKKLAKSNSGLGHIRAY